MKENDLLIRQAYIDEQLPVEEVIAFEAKLSREDKAALEAERRFETALADRLKAAAPCPDELWARVKGQIQSPAPQTLPPARRFWPRFAKPLAWAAIVVLNLGLAAALLNRVAGRTPELELAFNDDLQAFAETADIPGDIEKMYACLAASRLHVALAPPSPQQHPITPLGMRLQELGGEQVAQLFFSCCNRPMAVFVGRKEAFDLRNIPTRGLPGNVFVATREIDNYRIIVVGPHAPGEILDLFS